MNRSGFGKRFAAAAIDGTIIFVTVIIVTVLVSFEVFYGISTNSPDPQMSRTSLFLVKVLPLFPLVYLLPEILFACSLGKLICGLRICDGMGGVAPVESLVFRWFLKTSPNLVAFIGSLTGIVWLPIVAAVLLIFVVASFFFAAGQSKQALYDSFTATTVCAKAPAISQPT